MVLAALGKKTKASKAPRVLGKSYTEWHMLSGRWAGEKVMGEIRYQAQLSFCSSLVQDHLFSEGSV